MSLVIGIKKSDNLQQFEIHREIVVISIILRPGSRNTGVVSRTTTHTTGSPHCGGQRTLINSRDISLLHEIGEYCLNYGIVLMVLCRKFFVHR